MERVPRGMAAVAEVQHSPHHMITPARGWTRLRARRGRVYRGACSMEIEHRCSIIRANRDDVRVFHREETVGSNIDSCSNGVPPWRVSVSVSAGIL